MVNKPNHLYNDLEHEMTLTFCKNSVKLWEKIQMLWNETGSVIFIDNIPFLYAFT